AALCAPRLWDNRSHRRVSPVPSSSPQSSVSACRPLAPATSLPSSPAAPGCGTTVEAPLCQNSGWGTTVPDTASSSIPPGSDNHQRQKMAAHESDRTPTPSQTTREQHPAPKSPAQHVPRPSRTPATRWEHSSRISLLPSNSPLLCVTSGEFSIYPIGCHLIDCRLLSAAEPPRQQQKTGCSIGQILAEN